jgi:hypothetical protein
MNNTLNLRRACVAKILAISLLLFLSSCAPTTPKFDSHFGQAVRLTFAQQIITPEAGLNPTPVIGIDGRAAREAMGRYQNSFKEPTPAANNFTIGVSK